MPKYKVKAEKLIKICYIRTGSNSHFFESLYYIFYNFEPHEPKLRH